ncbi:PREDICTED: ubiquitin carboxyl-terminal hydrolase CYLD-like isoform X2 [Amphimedon queenslandica]|uniref:ubiquitinyl hydrolase 1 n=1 Tax=Amphimedon queenslandica TaxID=400682 RepID=A0A1X7VKP8_AMPQE|nr:PREDICTED: ubiquitin carboxyl-terminal hydrolase CYLD-like isoform X2 [Amphimedon queenslandica]|eukprot:XP_011409920.1 PREDICTED: ubiquitin carboxyl-terminal hydrolase CYLD-like isoform X2 [Amphimedon queenslandica]
MAWLWNRDRKKEKPSGAKEGSLYKENADQIKYDVTSYPPLDPGLPPDPHHQFTIGSMVRVDVQRGDPFYGVVQWMGTLPDYPGTIAGVEMERPLRDCTDGTWRGRRFFTCPLGKAYFCPLTALKQDTRYMDEEQVPAHMRQDIDNPLAKYSPVTEETDTMASPAELFNLYIGDARGIQGHHNSCYLDSTVFGLFALSNSFDVLLLEEPTEEVGRKVKYFLWKGIVNPLRKYGLARFESIMGLRDSLEEFGRMKGAKTDEKDPEEFLNLLFKEVLHIPPFLTIKRPFGIEKEYFIQLFFEIDPNNTEVPKTEKLIAQMFHEQNISFTRVPSKLLLQMPRFGKEFKMYSKIIPSLTLDVKLLMDPSARGGQKCKVCLRDSVSFVCYNCPECNERLHRERKGHRVEAVNIKLGTSDANILSKMELLSVICIETSHYVCYTRAGDKWLFHDSMADRLHDMYNVPRVVDVTAGLQEWIYSPTASEDQLMNTPARDIPEYVRIFTQDIYMCVYVNPDLDMYGDNDPEQSFSPNNYY